MHFFHFKPNSRKDNTLLLTCAAASGVTLVLCGCMLATPTHAWFTDDRSTGTSVIATGHYDVKVLDQQENTLSQPRVLGLAQEDLHVFNITANGTASTGYCIVTILSHDGTVEDTWYIDPIPQGTTVQVVIKASADTTVSFAPSWGAPPEDAQLLTPVATFARDSLPSVYLEVSSTPSLDYLVPEGATLEAIAAHYGVTAQDILIFNGLDALTPGEVIRIPYVTEETAPEAYEPKREQIHVVVEGDTLQAIADAYGVPLYALCQWNNIDVTDEIWPGLELEIPIMAPTDDEETETEESEEIVESEETEESEEVVESEETEESEEVVESEETEESEEVAESEETEESEEITESEETEESEEVAESEETEKSEEVVESEETEESEEVTESEETEESEEVTESEETEESEEVVESEETEESEKVVESEETEESEEVAESEESEVIEESVIIEESQVTGNAQAANSVVAEDNRPSYLINDVPLYFQNDYADVMYGSGTVATSGCSVTCLAMVGSAMTDYDYNPAELAEYFGGRAENNIERLEIGSDALHLAWEKSKNWDVTWQALQDGKMAIALMESDSMFTDNQHFIVLTGLNEEGLIMVNDPANYNYTHWQLQRGFEEGFTQNDILKGYSGAWIYDREAMPEEGVERYVEERIEKTPENSRYGFQITAEERELLARMVWVEARGECADGQQAVAEVVFNRMLSEQFGDTVKDVIYSEGQFESTPKLDTAEPYQAQYQAVDRALYGEPVLPMDVLYFGRAKKTDNVWGMIGGHIFCK